MNSRKLLLSASVILVFLAYVGYQQKYAIKTSPADVSQNVQVSQTETFNPTPDSSVLTGMYKDGTYVGKVVDAYYGAIQVKAVISGGRLTDVIFLQYPQERATSVRASERAISLLKSQAISSQQANVDIISGATETTLGFNKTLASALAQAQQ